MSTISREEYRFNVKLFCSMSSATLFSLSCILTNLLFLFLWVRSHILSFICTGTNNSYQSDSGIGARNNLALTYIGEILTAIDDLEHFFLYSKLTVFSQCFRFKKRMHQMKYEMELVQCYGRHFEVNVNCVWNSKKGRLKINSIQDNL